MWWSTGRNVTLSFHFVAHATPPTDACPHFITPPLHSLANHIAFVLWIQSRVCDWGKLAEPCCTTWCKALGTTHALACFSRATWWMTSIGTGISVEWLSSSIILRSHCGFIFLLLFGRRVSLVWQDLTWWVPDQAWMLQPCPQISLRLLLQLKVRSKTL